MLPESRGAIILLNGDMAETLFTAPARQRLGIPFQTLPGVLLQNVFPHPHPTATMCWHACERHEAYDDSTRSRRPSGLVKAVRQDMADRCGTD